MCQINMQIKQNSKKQINHYFYSFLLSIIIKQINFQQQFNINKRMNSYLPFNCQFKKYPARVIKKNSCHTRTEESVDQETNYQIKNITNNQLQDKRPIFKKKKLKYLEPFKLQTKSLEKREMKKTIHKNLLDQFNYIGDQDRNINKKYQNNLNKTELPEIDKNDCKIRLNKSSIIGLKRMVNYKNNQILDFMINILKDNQQASPKLDRKSTFIKKDNFFDQNLKNADNVNKSGIIKYKNYGPRVLANSITREARNINVIRRKLVSEQGARTNKMIRMNPINQKILKEQTNDEAFEITFYPKNKN